jgi:hypothetical protein
LYEFFICEDLEACLALLVNVIYVSGFKLEEDDLIKICRAKVDFPNEAQNYWMEYFSDNDNQLGSS